MKKQKKGRRWAKLLSRASTHLAIKLNENKIRESWAIGYDLHVWGFHEHALDTEIVKKTSHIRNGF